MLGTGMALYLITDLHEWFEAPWWSISLIGVGLLTLIVGVGLDHRERTRPASSAGVKRI